jgi:hypothetical protein
MKHRSMAFEEDADLSSIGSVPPWVGVAARARAQYSGHVANTEPREAGTPIE